jgi:hypothetical protein
MIKESIEKRVHYYNVTAPAYSRTLILDMTSLGYPVTQVITDVDKHHPQHIPIPFREREIHQEVSQTGHFNESAISLLIADYAKSN